MCEPAAGGCQDRDSSCKLWASLGHCATDRDFMAASCCNACRQGGAAPGVPGGIQGCPGDQEDECAAWALAGECEANAAFMGARCCASCGKKR